MPLDPADALNEGIELALVGKGEVVAEAELCFELEP